MLYAEPDSTIHVESTTVPTDPLFPLQWGLSNPDGIDVDATQAWQVTHGSPSIVVAVIDSGLDVNDPDLASQLWTNPKTGAHGWNFINNNANVTDNDGHGTHVAGIIAAAGDNGYGGIGLAWGVKLMPLKFINVRPATGPRPRRSRRSITRCSTAPASSTRAGVGLSSTRPSTRRSPTRTRTTWSS